MKRGKNVFPEIVSFKKVQEVLREVGRRNGKKIHFYPAPFFTTDRKVFYKQHPSPFGKQRMIYMPNNWNEEIMAFFTKRKQKNEVKQ